MKKKFFLLAYDIPNQSMLLLSGTTCFRWGRVRLEARGYILSSLSWEEIGGHQSCLCGLDPLLAFTWGEVLSLVALLFHSGHPYCPQEGQRLAIH